MVPVVTLKLHCVYMANFLCLISSKSLVLWCCDVFTRSIAEISMERCTLKTENTDCYTKINLLT